MEKKTVQRVYEQRQQARLDLIEAETALLMAACEEFQTWETVKKKACVKSSRFRNAWLELTPAQQNELRPELWGDAAKYIEKPRVRRDMTHKQLIEACRRRRFQLYDAGIQVRPLRKGQEYFVVGFVYRHNIDGTVQVDHRESLKRAIEWAVKNGQ